jgi:hypothetical protein
VVSGIVVSGATVVSPPLPLFSIPAHDERSITDKRINANNFFIILPPFDSFIGDLIIPYLKKMSIDS